MQLSTQATVQATGEALLCQYQQNVASLPSPNPRAKCVNGLTSVVGTFVPGVGVLKVPGALLQKTKDAITKVGQNTSVDDYDTLRELVEGNGDGPKSKEEMRGSSLRELERFLAEHDPDKNICRAVACHLGGRG